MRDERGNGGEDAREHDARCQKPCSVPIAERRCRERGMVCESADEGEHEREREAEIEAAVHLPPIDRLCQQQLNELARVVEIDRAEDDRHEGHEKEHDAHETELHLACGSPLKRSRTSVTT